jgi:hypothetical protein
MTESFHVCHGRVAKHGIGTRYLMSNSRSLADNELPLAASPTQSEPWVGRRGASWIGSLAWGVNMLLLIGLSAWIVRDPRIGPQMAIQWRQLNPQLYRELAGAPAITEANRRTATLQVLRVGAIVSLGVIVAALFVGAPQHRRVRSWLALTALVAAWLTVFTIHSSLAWAGQRWRAARQLDAFEAIAAPLRTHWPRKDGITDSLGAFNAYPIGKPRILMLLTSPPAAPPGMSFAAIERTGEGALRFDLIGNDNDLWLEWHPAGSLPGPFVGALMVQGSYELEQTAALGQGWYVSRYRPIGIIVTR